MKTGITAGTVAVLLALAPVTVRAGRSTDVLSELQECAPILLDPLPERGVVDVELTPPVFDAAQPDLDDLRVVDADGKAVPHVLSRLQTAGTRRERLEVRLYNRAFVPGERSSVTVDFGEKVLKNVIRVQTPGENFRRRVMVEGSDDGVNWLVIRRGAFLFQISGDGWGGAYDKDRVSISDNDQRYLRVTVFNGPDDPDHVPIDDVGAWHRVVRQPRTVPVPVQSVDIEQLPRRRQTEMRLDLGYRNLPLYSLQLEASEENFFRTVEVFGRPCEERTVTVHLEDGTRRQRVEEEPWARVTRTAIHRYSAGGHTEESLGISLRGAGHRYLLVRVLNGDNGPIRLAPVASARRLVRTLTFQPAGRGPYSLCFGNAEANAPDYDLPHFVDRLSRERVVSAQLGPVGPNPWRAGEPELPWSERHKGLIWAALLVAGGFLALLVYRQARETSRQTGPAE